MKSALSHSELRLFQRNRNEYFKRYIEGIEQPPNRKMILGSIIHAAIESQSYPWQRTMIENNMRQSISNIRKVLNKMRPKLPVGMGHELTRFANTKDGTRLMAIFDGYDEETKTLYEFKTTDKSERWNQGIVDDHQQLSFYAYIHYLNTHSYFKEIKLFCIDTARCTVKEYKTVRSSKDIKIIEDRVRQAVNAMKIMGWWEKRLSRKDRELKNNLQLI